MTGTKLPNFIISEFIEGLKLIFDGSEPNGLDDRILIAREVNEELLRELREIPYFDIIHQQIIYSGLLTMFLHNSLNLKYYGLLYHPIVDYLRLLTTT